MKTLKSFISFILLITINNVKSNPKFDRGGFVPSTIDYLDKNGKSSDQLAIATQLKNGNTTTTNKNINLDSYNISERSQEPRFGFTNVGGTGTGYGVTGYAPGKIDLGGLILGAVIGVGTILIIPKLLYIISGSYGTYARSDEIGFTNSLTKLDDILAHHGIDTTSCMQRAVCTYISKAPQSIHSTNDLNGDDDGDDKKTSFNRIIESVISNQIFRTAVHGTAIEEALETGRKGQNCSRIYRQCGFSMESIVNLFASVLSNINPPTAPASPL